jgi:hypothetical protein
VDALEFVGDIGRYAHCLAACRPNFAGHTLSPIRIQVIDSHFGTSCPQRLGNGFTDALPGSGDNGDFVIYSKVHATLHIFFRYGD